MVAESVEVKSKKLVSAPLISTVQYTGCGLNGVSGVDVKNLPLEISHVKTGKETEGERESALVENTRETSVLEILLNTATAMTLMAVEVSAKKNHSCVRNCILSRYYRYYKKKYVLYGMN